MITITAIDTPGLGDRTYLAHDGHVAIVIDPQRDFDRVLAAAEHSGVTVTHVFETHIHNDYVTGGLALAAEVGAEYLVNAEDAVSFQRTGIHDGDLIEVSKSMRVRVVHTPGHTHTHLSYALEVDGQPYAVFTGGSLLYGSTGRPDLLGPDHTDVLVHAQWRSAHRLADELPDETAVYPTHGFGSFCSATQSDGQSSSSIGEERRSNPALTQGEQEYVDQLLAGLDSFPAYYARMGPANSAGPAAPDLSTPVLADPEELRRRIDAGEWVVDLRDRSAFAAGHLAGSLNFGLDGQFITYLGWLIPWDIEVTLLGETPEAVAAAQRDMVRIGLSTSAMATGKPDEWAGGTSLASFPVATFGDLAEAMAHGDPAVLDVRRDQERAESHIAGSLHIPIHDVLNRIAEVPRESVWVHCAGGYRASVVAALLDARGYEVVSVDDSFDRAAGAGLAIITPTLQETNA